MLRFHQVAADPAQVKHVFSGTVPSTQEMVHDLRGGGLRARVVNSSVPRVVSTPLPAVALMDGGSCVRFRQHSRHGPVRLRPV
jgi:subfamily B ATP-binding cassette protein HlyB/CyaB